MDRSIQTTFAPIALFVYNRPRHTRKTLESLMGNKLAAQSELFIYADGPKQNATTDDLSDIQEVRRLIREKKWCGTVHIRESELNKGLADSIIGGVTELVNQFGRVIVLEDDFVLSRSFLTYMNQALTIYADDDKVVHVSGYMYPVKGSLPDTFFVNLATCWGWGTWKRAWDHLEYDPALLLDSLNKAGSKSRFNLEDSYDWYSHLVANVDGRMKTWAIRWYASFFLMNGYSLHPHISLVRNIGNDGSGEHCSSNDRLLNQKIGDLRHIRKMPVVESLKARKLIKDYFTGSHIMEPSDPIRDKIVNLLRRAFNKLNTRR